jgi:hypothetical protein
MTRSVAITLVLIAASCTSSAPPVENTTFGTLAFQVPAQWHSRTLSDVYTERIEWTPSDNRDKQSIVLIHTSPRPTDIEAGTDGIQRLLESAQQGLAKATFGKPRPIVNDHGFRGAMIEGSFVPAGQTEPYQRLHAVLVDRQMRSFVHVLFTGRVADREAFEVVVDSVSRRGV